MTNSLYDNIHSTKHAGKVALVTGGSTGIGLATAKRLAREGATVFISGRRQAELDAAVIEVVHGARAIRGDISSAADLKTIVDTVSAAHQKIDILFANAGGGEFVPLGEITEAQFDKYFDINVKGTLLTVQSALPLMPAGSAIVITGSIASIQGIPAFGVYAATKAALRSFARTWPDELASLCTPDLDWNFRATQACRPGSGARRDARQSRTSFATRKLWSKASALTSRRFSQAMIWPSFLATCNRGSTPLEN